MLPVYSMSRVVWNQLTACDIFPSHGKHGVALLKHDKSVQGGGNEQRMLDNG